ncbi:MAG: 5-formyltetrahydrofolate cyclo-ligase [Cypionkella sp.]|nr:5-formyltetrahydrofolate cyclo-ligase [Cypionkella sp.]
MDAAVKATARKDAFARRKAAFLAAGAQDMVARANDHMRAALRPFAGQVLAGYMPMRTEIDPLAAMHDHQGALCVPVIIAAATPLKFAAYFEGTKMQAGEFGALIPAKLAYLTPQVLIVPLLAYDARGYRLGYGGGFYDRTLAGLRARGPVTAIGFAFSAQKMGEVPTDATDQALDMIVTENGILRF